MTLLLTPRRCLDLPTVSGNICVVKLPNCNVRSLDFLARLLHLRELYAPFNAISGLDALWGMDALEVLDLESNLIADESALLVLSTLPNLRDVTLAGNPVWTEIDKKRLEDQYLPKMGHLRPISAKNRTRTNSASSRPPRPLSGASSQVTVEPAFCPRPASSGSTRTGTTPAECRLRISELTHQLNRFSKQPLRVFRRLSVLHKT